MYCVPHYLPKQCCKKSYATISPNSKQKVGDGPESRIQIIYQMECTHNRQKFLSELKGATRGSILVPVRKSFALTIAMNYFIIEWSRQTESENNRKAAFRHRARVWYPNSMFLTILKVHRGFQLTWWSATSCSNWSRSVQVNFIVERSSHRW